MELAEKRKPRIGIDSNTRTAEHYVLVGKKDGTYKWADKKIWDAAIWTRRNGAATKEQKEMLDNGRWKAQ